MILDREFKRALMLNPKTGTMSLATLLSKHSTLRVAHEHSRLTYLEAVVGEEYPNYKVYCFYRNPIDRFISGFNYSKSGKIASFTNYLALLYRNKTVPLFSNLHNKPIPELQNAIQDLTLSEFLNPKDSRVYECVARMDSSFLLEKQVAFCKHPNVVLLDFDNYEENVRFVLKEFGLDPSVDIPHLNTINKEEHNLSPADIERIKQIYKEDYDFFESVNIKF